MVLRARVRVGIALHAAVNVGFAGVALATTVPVPGLASAGAAPPPIELAAALDSAPVVVDLRPTTSTTTTTTAPARTGRTRTVTSTGYCLRGTTASGREVGPGQAAMNDVALGTRVRLLDGPLAGTDLVVTDRIGHGTELDLWFADCDDALEYGRRRITIRLVP